MATSIRDNIAGLIVLRLGSNMIPLRTAEEDAQAVKALLDLYPLGGSSCSTGGGRRHDKCFLISSERAIAVCW